MSSTGKQLRLGKIFREDGRTLIVPIDHGLDYGPLPGIEEPLDTIKKIVAGKPDAILAHLGIIKAFAKELSAFPSVIMTIPSDMTAIPFVEEAVKLGVDAVKVGVFTPLSQREKYEDFRSEYFKYEIIRPISVACEKWGMPLLAEPVPTTEKGELIHDPGIVKMAARMAAEMGADFLKVAYTGSPETFEEVVRTCPAPVTIMGGPKIRTPRDILEMVKGAIDAGGVGVAFGRNIWQYEHPTAMIIAISKILHENASVQEALKELK